VGLGIGVGLGLGGLGGGRSVESLSSGASLVNGWKNAWPVLHSK